MIKRKINLICVRCGRQFKYELKDAVMPEDWNLLRHPLCKKCRLICLKA